MGKETKVGLAVILILLVVLGAVLFKRMRGTGQPPTAKAPPTKEAEPTTPKPKLSSGPTKPTLLKPSTTASKPPGKSSTRWESSSRASQDDSSEPGTSYMPQPSSTASSQRYQDDQSDSLYGQSQAVQRAGTRDLALQSQSTPGPYGTGSARATVEVTDDASSRYGTTTVTPTAKTMVGSVVERSTRQSSMYSGSSQTAQQPYTRSVPAGTSYGQYGTQGTFRTASSPYGSGGATYYGRPGSSTQGIIPQRENTGKYHVEPGDSFWKISQKIYGDGGYFKALREHNRARFPQPDRLQIGDEVLTPQVETLREKYSGLCPKPRTAKPGTPQFAQVGTSILGGGPTYVVEEGDTLYDIARYELGESSRWVEIYQLNSTKIGDDIDYLRPGTSLVLPSTQPYQQPQTEDALTRQPGTILRR